MSVGVSVQDDDDVCVPY